MYCTVFHTVFTLMLITSTPDLGQPLVSVMSNDIAIAGLTFSRVCTVETIEGVRSKDVSIGVENNK